LAKLTNLGKFIQFNSRKIYKISSTVILSYFRQNECVLLRWSQTLPTRWPTSIINLAGQQCWYNLLWTDSSMLVKKRYWRTC